MAKPQSIGRVSVLLVGLVLAVFVLVSTQVMAAAPSITFSGAVNLSNTSERSRWSSVAFDSAGKAHVTWLQQADVNVTGRIMYTNNVGGAVIAPIEIDRGEGSIDPTTSIVAENSRVHVFVSGAGNNVAHILLTLNGAQPTITARTQLAGRKSTSSAAVVDTAGRVHAAWISNEEGQYQVYHRIWQNGAWEPSARIVKPEDKMQKYPNLVATSDGRVHIGFRSGDPGVSKTQGTFAYFEWSGSAWQDAADPPAGGNNDTLSLGSDGANLYAIWENSDTHQLAYARRINSSWTGASGVPGQKTYNNQPTIFGTPNGRAYAVWSRGSASGDREEMVVGEVTANGVWSDIVRLGQGEPEGARGAYGGGSIGVVWHDKPSSDIWFSIAGGPAAPAPATPAPATPSPTTPPPAMPSPTTPPAGSIPSGSMTIDNGAAITNQATVSVELSNTSAHEATGYSLRDGASVDSGAFTNPSTVRFPLDVGDGACRTHTVSGTLTGPGGTSAAFSDSITYDPSVDPQVEIRSTLTDGGRSASPAAAPDAFSPGFGPASGGDPAHTRFEFFYANVTPGANECSGIKSFTIGGAGVSGNPIMPNIWSLNAGPGAYDIAVSAADNAGNSTSRVYKLFYDVVPPARTFPAGDIPVLREEIDGVPVMSMSGLSVRDNLYAGDGDGKQYWGYWVVVKRDDGSMPSENEWRSFGAVVRARLGDTLSWNIRSGLAGTFEPGSDYRVYVSVLDGAGNASEPLRSAAFQVNTLPPVQVFVPLVSR